MADWEEFDAEVATAPVSGEALEALEEAAAAIQGQRVGRVQGYRTVLWRALAERDAANALEASLSHVLAATPALFVEIRDEILPTIHRMTLPFPN